MKIIFLICALVIMSNAMAQELPERERAVIEELPIIIEKQELFTEKWAVRKEKYEKETNTIISAAKQDHAVEIGPILDSLGIAIYASDAVDKRLSLKQAGEDIFRGRIHMRQANTGMDYIEGLFGVIDDLCDDFVLDFFKKNKSIIRDDFPVDQLRESLKMVEVRIDSLQELLGEQTQKESEARSIIAQKYPELQVEKSPSFELQLSTEKAIRDSLISIIQLKDHGRGTSERIKEVAVDIYVNATHALREMNQMIAQVEYDLAEARRYEKKAERALQLLATEQIESPSGFDYKLIQSVPRENVEEVEFPN